MKMIIRTNAFGDHLEFSSSSSKIIASCWSTIFGSRVWSVSGHGSRARSCHRGGISESRNR